MAKKISQLTQATQVKSDDVTVIVQDGETKKLPLNMMVTKQDIENKKVAGLAKLDEIEATYENDTYTPTITVKNKSSVKTGEGDEVDYSANVMDGPAKSAILSGQTLVNLQPKGSSWVGNTGVMWYNESIPNSLFKPNTKYFLKFNSDLSNILESCYLEACSPVYNHKIYPSVSGCYAIMTTNEAPDGGLLHVYPKSGIELNSTTLNENVRFVFTEYQEGMENWDIPYFEDMQSVKMPVLTTVGKNTFNIKNKGAWRTGWYSIPLEIPFNGEVYVKCADSLPSDFRINLLAINKNEHVLTNEEIKKGHTAYYQNLTDIEFHCPSLSIEGNSRGILDDLVANGDIVIVVGGEPYKSNILTVNEPVELRGIGDVQDTLDLMTGELTERIGEVVLNGSESWSVLKESDNAMTFRMSFPNFPNYDKMLCSVLKTQNPYLNPDDEGIWHNNSGRLLLTLLKTKVPNVDSLKTYLAENNITFHHQLAESVIKTVDLIPSGTHPSTTPYCWENGHIQLSSSGLLPNLEYSVVTSRAGQINQNATMIVKNDKRIFDLEILLASGLVNTTYQALTLQNQVETGLSKVSLSSETEPDYLLYHMIMKLIEEKAYKLDDLTEKVSVFYLYEKLSDEQFETIYSALYPFVEDEIVEEPVVEELPEVVEDEVIM